MPATSAGFRRAPSLCRLGLPAPDWALSIDDGLPNEAASAAQREVPTNSRLSMALSSKLAHGNTPTCFPAVLGKSSSIRAERNQDALQMAGRIGASLFRIWQGGARDLGIDPASRGHAPNTREARVAHRSVGLSRWRRVPATGQHQGQS